MASEARLLFGVFTLTSPGSMTRVVIDVALSQWASFVLECRVAMGAMRWIMNVTSFVDTIAEFAGGAADRRPAAAPTQVRGN